MEKLDESRNIIGQKQWNNVIWAYNFYKEKKTYTYFGKKKTLLGFFLKQWFGPYRMQYHLVLNNINMLLTIDKLI